MLKSILKTSAIITVGVYAGTSTASALAAGSLAKFTVGWIIGCAAAKATDKLLEPTKEVSLFE